MARPVRRPARRVLRMRNSDIGPSWEATTSPSPKPTTIACTSAIFAGGNAHAPPVAVSSPMPASTAATPAACAARGRSCRTTAPSATVVTGYMDPTTDTVLARPSVRPSAEIAVAAASKGARDARDAQVARTAVKPPAATAKTSASSANEVARLSAIAQATPPASAAAFSAVKNTPKASADDRPRHPGSPPADAVVWIAVERHQHAAGQGHDDARRGYGTPALAAGQRDHQRDHGGQRRQRRHHAHAADGERGIERREADHEATPQPRPASGRRSPAGPRGRRPAAPPATSASRPGGVTAAGTAFTAGERSRVAAAGLLRRAAHALAHRREARRPSELGAGARVARAQGGGQRARDRIADAGGGQADGRAARPPAAGGVGDGVGQRALGERLVVARQVGGARRPGPDGGGPRAGGGGGGHAAGIVAAPPPDPRPGRGR